MPGGRPPKLDEVIRHRDVRDPDTQELVDSRPVTRREQILADIGTGMYAERACRANGVHKDTFYEWEKIAGHVLEREAKARQNGSRPIARSMHEKACVEFSDAIRGAEAEWERAKNVELERLERGGVTRTIETVKVQLNADGTEKVVERSTRTETTLPDAAITQWRLTRRFPRLYNPRTVLAGIDDAGEEAPLASVEERADALAARLARHLRREEAAK